MTYRQYTHDLILKNSKEPIYNGVLSLRTGDTKILELKSSQENTPRTCGQKRTIVIPGLINLHCHLQHADQDIPPKPLFRWLKELVQKKQNINQMGEVKALSKKALDSAQEALSFGTSFIVDNTDCLEASLAALRKTGQRGLIGLEIFGSDSATPLNTDALEKIWATSGQVQTEKQISLCLSPHACYDVSAELWGEILDYSKKHKLKILSHIAESQAEEAWFKDKDSPEAQAAREFWASIKTLDSKLKTWKAYKGSVDFLKQNKLLDSSLLLAHGVHCSEEDLIELKNSGISLVTCPRSNLYLQNGLADYALWEKLGILYGIGTDSKASNQDLDLRKELEHIPLSPERKFELVTSQAAKILGLENKIGGLEAGKEADWVVLEVLNDELDLRNLDPYQLALDTKLTKVKEVFIAGVLNGPFILPC